jgi:phospholipid transport system substrate-binding protein
MIRLSRRAWLLSATVSTAGAAIASMGPAWIGTAWADIPDPVAQPLHDLHSALEATMRAGRTTPFPDRFDALAPVVDQVFDLETVLKVSVGLRWDGMDGDVRDRLLRAYRRFTVATYVANFDRYDGKRFEVLPGARASGTDRIVGTELVTRGGQHVRIDYVMRVAGDTWRAVDILWEGSISRVAVQRSDFRKILVSGDAEALIASLRRKIADLSDGALNA